MNIHKHVLYMSYDKHENISVKYKDLLLCIYLSINWKILNILKLLGETLLNSSFSIQLHLFKWFLVSLTKCEFQSKTVYKALVFWKAAQKLLLQLSLHKGWLCLFLVDWKQWLKTGFTFIFCGILHLMKQWITVQASKFSNQITTKIL